MWYSLSTVDKYRKSEWRNRGAIMTGSDKDSGGTRLKISIVTSHKKWGGITQRLVVNPNYIWSRSNGNVGPLTAELWLKWMSTAPCLIRRPLSAIWVTCCASMGAVTVSLMIDALWPGEISVNSCLSKPPDTSCLRYTARYTWPAFALPFSLVVKHWQGSTLRVVRSSNPTLFVLRTSWVDNLVVQF